ncbi:MAG: DUF1223 domain-containing protein [Rudaea sp.]
MLARTLIILVALATANSAHAQCAAQSSTSRPHLIELYTSEGCSSCPPAEHWLHGLRGAGDTVALEFHVDYWDSLGWRDRFANARYTARQQDLARRAGNGVVYTPEAVLDGHEWRDWYRGGALPAKGNATATMTLSATRDGSDLTVHIDTHANDAADVSAFRTYVALIESGLSSQVRGGENRGELLRHDHVVRAFTGPLPLVNANAQLTLPADADLNHAALVAFAQRAQDGAIAQVVSLPLAGCAR